MISRRKILSRSLDNLDAISPADEEDVWYDKDKLCKDHIHEVLEKWSQIDDEIWAKIIVFERNRRVAKAYARSPVITINGSKHGFDGVRIGLNGFENPMRDSKTLEAKKLVGDGFKIKMDDTGNILIKRYGKSNVYVQSNLQNVNEETVIGSDILKLPNCALQVGKSATLFDMKKFSVNVHREFSRSYPDRSRLELQCLSAVSLVKTNEHLLNCPVWILVINVVAIDMLKSKMTNIPRSLDTESQSPASGNEDPPYSTIDSQTELIPPKVNSSKISAKYDEIVSEPKPDYENYAQPMPTKPLAGVRDKANKSKLRKKQDDPYYCGLLARIPNFIKTSKPCKKKELKSGRRSSAQFVYPVPIASLHQFQYPVHYPYRLYPAHHPISQSQYSLWDSRSLIGGLD